MSDRGGSTGKDASYSSAAPPILRVPTASGRSSFPFVAIKAWTRAGVEIVVPRPTKNSERVSKRANYTTKEPRNR